MAATASVGATTTTLGGVKLCQNNHRVIINNCNSSCLSGADVVIALAVAPLPLAINSNSWSSSSSFSFSPTCKLSWPAFDFNLGRPSGGEQTKSACAWQPEHFGCHSHNYRPGK